MPPFDRLSLPRCSFPSINVALNGLRAVLFQLRLPGLDAVDTRIRDAQQQIQRMEAVLARQAEDVNVARQLQWHSDGPVDGGKAGQRPYFDMPVENMRDGAVSRQLASALQENEQVCGGTPVKASFLAALYMLP
jgi:hypothetical protein